MKKRIILVIVIVVTVMTIVLIYNSKHPSLKGVVEGTVYGHITEVAGKILQVNVQLGQSVQEGEIIAIIDDTDMRFALEQMEINLHKRKLAHALLVKGATFEELEKARSDVSIAEANQRSAEATLTKATEDTKHFTQLHLSGGISQNELDLAVLREKVAVENVESAAASVQKAQKQYALLNRGAEKETIALADAEIRESQSKVNQLSDSMQKHSLKAITSGIVISLPYQIGAVVSPGANICDISSNTEKYVVCYIPKKLAAKINYYDLFAVSSGKNSYIGTVKYFDQKSQFTPKDMQTAAQKNKTSQKIKLLLPPEAVYKSGTEVKVRL